MYVDHPRAICVILRCMWVTTGCQCAMTRVWDTLTCWHSIRCISVFWHLSLFTVLFVSNSPFQTCQSCVSPSHKTRFVHCQILNSDLFVDFISVCDVWARFSEPLLHQVASLVVEWVRELQALQARLHEERHELSAERALRSSLEDLEDLLEGNWHWISKQILKPLPITGWPVCSRFWACFPDGLSSYQEQLADMQKQFLEAEIATVRAFWVGEIARKYTRHKIRVVLGTHFLSSSCFVSHSRHSFVL